MALGNEFESGTGENSRTATGKTATARMATDKMGMGSRTATQGTDYPGLDPNYQQPPQPQQNGYPDDQYPSGPLGNPPFPPDLY